MQDPIMIGCYKKENHNSKCLWNNANISQNKEFYIIRNLLFQTSIYISKGSPEVIDFEIWLAISGFPAKQISKESIEEKSLEYLLPFLTTRDILQMVEKEVSNAFSSGSYFAQKQIRTSLGIT